MRRVAWCRPRSRPRDRRLKHRQRTQSKVTIVPRGRAGGGTSTLPRTTPDEVSREWCLDRNVTMAMGGRSAEKLISPLGQRALSDILQATRRAPHVTRWA